jgi:uncharacterized membrane protein YccC
MSATYIAKAKRLFSQASKSPWLAHSARTGLAAAVSFAIARTFKLPEDYWAAVTTIVVMQSTLGAAWSVSKQRLTGTALGAAVAALLGSYFAPGLVLYGSAIIGLGLICALLRLDRSAYRFAGITLTIVLLPMRNVPFWTIGLHRFLEVSLGICVALLFTALWPQPEPIIAKTPKPSHHKSSS